MAKGCRHDYWHEQLDHGLRHGLCCVLYQESGLIMVLLWVLLSDAVPGSRPRPLPGTIDLCRRGGAILVPLSSSRSSSSSPSSQACSFTQASSAPQRKGRAHPEAGTPVMGQPKALRPLQLLASVATGCMSCMTFCIVQHRAGADRLPVADPCLGGDGQKGRLCR